MQRPTTSLEIVVGVSGGIAAYKACAVVRQFKEAGHQVTVIPTEAALHFVGAATWEALSGRPVSTSVWSGVDEVRHVRLGQEADLVVVAPATADLLARAASGMANDLLTSTLLVARCPVVMAPAMHTEMWQHPSTVANVEVLRSRGVHVIDPDSGRLTGADTGPGRLPEPEVIAAKALQVVQGGGDLEGRTVLVTSGGTREAFDPVRYLGNHSSGKQGNAIAQAARERGADVILVRGATSVPDPHGVEVVPVESALDMEKAVAATYERADVVVMAAAVADYRPAVRSGHKMKKDPASQDAPTIELVRNPDILAGLAQRRGGMSSPVLVGFAAETGDDDGTVLDHARAKLRRKGCDVLVANEVGDGITFGQDTTTVHVLERSGNERVVGPTSKMNVAHAVLDAALSVSRATVLH